MHFDKDRKIKAAHYNVLFRQDATGEFLLTDAQRRSAAENHRLKYLNFKFPELYNSKEQVRKRAAKKFTVKRHDDGTFRPVAN